MDHVWKIYKLERVIADGMVTSVTYACESNYSGSTTRNIGDLSLTTGSVSDNGFISYENLTEATVLNWILPNIDKSSIETVNSASIAEDIIAKAAITKTNGTPW
tara:strand:- start:312 stop:623 length:312 start_codon:yes stop_codon:yes gene_type:complete